MSLFNFVSSAIAQFTTRYPANTSAEESANETAIAASTEVPAIVPVSSTINRKKLFDGVRHAVYGGRIKSSQVEGVEAILTEWEKRGGVDLRHIAYMLATAFHETARTMQPVRETLADTDDKAIAILDKSFAAGKLKWVKTPYWRKDAGGFSWMGRGYVQLTHKANYLKFGIHDPSDAMRVDVALRVLFDGMANGSFTGKKLSDYFNEKVTDWTNARRIINGTESAEKVANYAKSFYSALTSAAAGISV